MSALKAGVHLFLIIQVWNGVHASSSCGGEDVWCVRPYVQNPSATGMTLQWFTKVGHPGDVIVRTEASTGVVARLKSTPEREGALEVSDVGGTTGQGLGSRDRDGVFRHRVRIEGLSPGVTYAYEVVQDEETVKAEFRTSPRGDAAVRFIVYADSETEPESTGTAVGWPRPFSDESRTYLVDQTEGYRRNLAVIQERNPDFVAIAGDLVEKGGRQRDWDEFWRHNSGEYGNLASSTPIFPAIGNHENYEGSSEGYSIEGARRSIAKFQAYFEVPDNGVFLDSRQSRYYRVDYGPITLITLDSSSGCPDRTDGDSNFMLLCDEEGGGSPDFNPGSEQYRWLERQLEDASRTARFVFVQFHHMPYSVGPHGLPAGEGNGFDNQSGQPLRVLSPLFEQYGVCAVFCGHDEIYEHAIVNGVHYYDVGIGGDGLRGPFVGEDGSSGLPGASSHQVFLAHTDAPEVWEGRRLVDGGKHYGHVEVNVGPVGNGFWEAEILPVYVFPVTDSSGQPQRFERRVYDDVVKLRTRVAAAE